MVALRMSDEEGMYAMVAGLLQRSAATLTKIDMRCAEEGGGANTHAHTQPISSSSLQLLNPSCLETPPPPPPPFARTHSSYLHSTVVFGGRG